MLIARIESEFCYGTDEYEGMIGECMLDEECDEQGGTLIVEKPHCSIYQVSLN